jgi:hypothetical protein
MRHVRRSLPSWQAWIDEVGRQQNARVNAAWWHASRAPAVGAEYTVLQSPLG